jgi:hypothetical protein
MRWPGFFPGWPSPPSPRRHARGPLRNSASAVARGARLASCPGGGCQYDVYTNEIRVIGHVQKTRIRKIHTGFVHKPDACARNEMRATRKRSPSAAAAPRSPNVRCRGRSIFGCANSGNRLVINALAGPFPRAGRQPPAGRQRWRGAREELRRRSPGERGRRMGRHSRRLTGSGPPSCGAGCGIPRRHCQFCLQLDEMHAIGTREPG